MGLIPAPVGGGLIPAYHCMKNMSLALYEVSPNLESKLQRIAIVFLE